MIGRTNAVVGGGGGGGLDITDCTLYVHNLHMDGADLYYGVEETVRISSTQFATIEHVNLAHDIYALDTSFYSQLPLTVSYDKGNGYFRITIYPV